MPPNKQTKILKVIFCIDILIGLSWLNTGTAYSQTLPPQFVRENINQFMNKPTRIAAFTRGIQVMKQRPASDPTSWAFQANIHGSSDTSQPLWNQCQHRHWWFLAWHRAYMYYLERMLQRASGESRLRLPYWNYTDPTSRSLPAPFRDPSSVLFVSGRNLTTPTDEVTPSSVNTSIAMSRINFVGSDAQLGFGGGPEPVPVQFPFTDKAGSLEKLPHNAIHVQVGGIMQNARTAALDPIFWLHHSNIDRLWEAWLRSGRANPVDPVFLNATFTLYNENGVRVTHRVRDFLVNTQQLGYTYDDQPVTSVAAADQPIGDAAHPVALVADAKSNTGDMPDVETPPSPAASNFTFSTLAETSMKIPASVLAQPLTIRVQPKLESPDAKRLLTNVLPPEEAETRYLLVLEDIDFVKAPTNIYELYLNFPTADYTTMGESKYYIGPLSFFESDVNTHHKQHQEKRSETFDITDVVHALQRDRTLNMNDLSVTIVPIGIIKKGKPTKPVNPIPLKLNSVKIVAVKKPPEEESKNKIKEDDY